MAIVSALGQSDTGENKRAVASLLLGMRAWLLQAAVIDWLPAEFQALAEISRPIRCVRRTCGIRADGAPARARQPDLAVPRDRRAH